MDDVVERAVGSVLGLAAGDALGAPFEFQRAADIPVPVPAFELDWLGLPPGTWTDDTAMARNLWMSLIDHGGRLDTDDVLARHLAWLGSSPPDVGNLTRKVLRDTQAGVPRGRARLRRAARSRGERRERLRDVLRPPGGGVRSPAGGTL